MNGRDGTARIVLGVVVGLFVLDALWLDLPEWSNRQFWNDAATYYSMALSLAKDGDLRYEARDLERVRKVYPSGPQGIFLKRTSGALTLDREAGFPWIRRVRPDEKRLYFAKPFVYPLAAAPLVALLGPSHGLLLTNALFLALALVLGYRELRQQAGPLTALFLALVLFLGTVTPVYFLWLTPEIFNLGLVTAGLVAWRRGRPLLSAVLLGIAAYAKPTNLFLALPLGLEPLVAAGVEAGPGGRLRALGRGLVASVRRGAVMAAVVLGLFGLNAAATGEMNYQGGERKTFYGVYPFQSAGIGFDDCGYWMTTDYVGPLVAGQDEEKYVGRTAPPRPAEELRASFLLNLGYFWIGRFAGAVPYFFPAVLAAVLFLLLGPRDRAGGLALVALLASYLVYILLIPDNWYGGGGTVGNRYFVNLLPLSLFFVPRGKEWLITGGGLLAAIVLLCPIFASPLRHSLKPGTHATYAAFRIFPAEITMLNDLSASTDLWRKARRFGDTEGDPETGRRADPTAYYLYFPDNGTYGHEFAFGGDGFWLRGGEKAEVILRALEPVRRMRVKLIGGPAGDIVTVRLGRLRRRVPLKALQTGEVVLEPRGRGFGYYDTFVYVLEFGSRTRGTSPHDPRILGAFVQIRLEVEQRSGQQQPVPSWLRGSAEPLARTALASSSVLSCRHEGRGGGLDGLFVNGRSSIVENSRQTGRE